MNTGSEEVREISEILEQYDRTSDTGRNKIEIIEWFQTHPGRRFDITEVHQELKDDLEVGRGRTGQLLRELEEESVMVSHGEKRKAYQLAEDILIPVKYQAAAGLRHLWSIFDVERWGMSGIFVMSTTLWIFLTLPFWFLTIVLVVSPSSNLGPFGESELVIFTIAMTVWLVVLVIATYLAQLMQRGWSNRGQ